MPPGTSVTIGGLVTGLQRKVTRRGDTWAIATVEDLEGSVDVMLFPATYQQHALQVAEDTIVVVKGRVDRRDDAPQVIASDLSLPDLSEAPVGPVVVSMRRGPVYAAAGRAAQGRARHAPGCHRGPLAAADGRSHNGDAPRRRPEGHAFQRTDGRPEGSARPGSCLG